MTNADQRNARDISGEVTNTRVVPIKNSVVINVWDDMKQFKSRKTIGLARQGGAAGQTVHGDCGSSPCPS